MESMTVSRVYKELTSLRHEVEELKAILLPVEKMTRAERDKFRRVLREMQAGNEVPAERVFA